MNRSRGELLAAAASVAETAFIAVVSAAVPAQPAAAAVYLSTETAQRALFPQAQSFTEAPLTLTDAQKQEIARIAGPQAPHGELRAWAAVAEQKVIGHVFIDEVVGRQDFITYAVGIDAAGKLRPVEVLEYRESHGGDIRLPAWRRQFAGKTPASPLRVGEDIANISGATLSCQHVTEGVRRIVAVVQMATKNGSLT